MLAAGISTVPAVALPDSAPQPVPVSAANNPTDELTPVTITAPEPRYVAPTRRDQIGRIWAPVYINGQGPFRLVLDSGATSSEITAHVAGALGLTLDASHKVLLRGSWVPLPSPSSRCKVSPSVT